ATPTGEGSPGVMAADSAQTSSPSVAPGWSQPIQRARTSSPSVAPRSGSRLSFGTSLSYRKSLGSGLSAVTEFRTTHWLRGRPQERLEGRQVGFIAEDSCDGNSAVNR